MSDLSKMTEFLDRLDGAGIQYTMSSVTEGAITVSIAAGVERWEVEFSGSGDIEVQIYKPDGKIYDFSITEQLFQQGNN